MLLSASIFMVGRWLTITQRLPTMVEYGSYGMDFKLTWSIQWTKASLVVCYLECNDFFLVLFMDAIKVLKGGNFGPIFLQ